MVEQGLYYTQDHEWIKIEGQKATIGISDHAQNSLGEITFIELPEVGREVDVKDELAVVESSKAASDVYAPLSGKVIEVNDRLENEPELINNDCYSQGWIAKLDVSNDIDLDNLMDAEKYKNFIGHE